MLEALVDRRNKATIRLSIVDVKGMSRWPKATRLFLQASGFHGKSGQLALVPGSKGLERAIAGPPKDGLWGWASIAERLPRGRYVIEGELDDATEVAIGWSLAAYRFDRYKEGEPAAELVWPPGADRDRVRSTVRAFGLSRDLINLPAQDLGPEELGEIAKKIAGRDAKCTVSIATAKSYPTIHAVGRASSRAPRVIDLRWGDARHPKLTIAGKGVCFDTGGLDIKPADSMLRMKKDMGGAAIALSLARMIMDARLPVRLRVLIGAVDNAIGPDAYRPLDVIETRKGLTVEVTHTDAEGRLVLCDLLAEGDREAPDLLIDVATLTGAARVALGPSISPFFTPDHKLAGAISRAAKRARDPVWRLPLFRPYRKYIESKVADLRNSPTVPMGGAISAALFLEAFVERARSWVHFDVYGWNESPRPGRPMGGEATGLRAMWAMLEERYPKK